jgi:DtxR family Mn-dependent transcriptional regulator
LEAILVLTRQTGVARSKDIAARLGVKSPTVTTALRALREQGLVHYEPYEFAYLTEQGAARANSLVRKSEILRKFCERVLRLDRAQSEEAARIMKQSVPADVVERMAKLIRYVDQCPNVTIRWREDRFVCASWSESDTCRNCEALSA